MSWDADTYDRVADPQEAWAREIIARGRFTPGELVLDAGCGSGRVTELLLDQGLRVVAVDADPAMVEKARERLGDRARVERQDLLDLALDEPVDAVFSCAVFHWITDHERLFARLHAALRPGGRLVAQCGGHGNIATVVAAVPDRPSPWLYATPQDTERRLRAAGFTRARAWLEPKPTTVADPETYVAAVCLHGHPRARELAPKVVAALGDPPVIDYVRLNMEARA
ncbi:MAG TPA: methyltransferase domain-containing protein [Solirubrobacteraceae bacterium]|nr:methyltransferase domain-containing protein [Solirubrobacteraceae bacterium]